MVNRLRVERSQIKAERDQLKEIIAQVVLALPALAGAAGEEIAREIMNALPPSVGESATQGGYTLPAPAPQQQLPAPQQSQQHQLPAVTGRPNQVGPDAASAGAVVMPMLPDGFPLDAIPPEYRAQAAQQRNGSQQPQQQPQQAPQAPQGRPGIQPPRFGQPRQQQAQQPPIDVPYNQPNQPGVTIQRNVGITDVFHDGSNGKGGNVKIGRLAGGGAPQGAPASRPNPGAARISGLQAAVAKARAAAGGDNG